LGGIKARIDDPILIKNFLDQEVVDVACGDNHCACLVNEACLSNTHSLTKLDANIRLVYTWGAN
jgi:hypothetical protein